MLTLTALTGLMTTLLAAPESNKPSSKPKPALEAPLPPPRPAPADRRWQGAEKTVARLAKQAVDDAQKKRPTALARLHRLWNLNRILEQPVESAIHQISQMASARPLVRAHATYLEAKLLFKKAKLKEAEEALKRLGFITEAQVIGPFDNAAGRGHDELFVPELGMKLEDTAQGKAHPIGWRRIVGMVNAGTFELSQLLHPPSEGTAYLAVVLEAKRATRAALRTGAKDQLKVFFAGTLVASVDQRRALGMDQDAIPLSIPKGHSLLVLKSSWTGSTGRLMARLTRPNGAPLQGVRVLSDHRTLKEAMQKTKWGKTKAQSFWVQTASGPLDTLLARRVGNTTQRAEHYALSADLDVNLALYDERKRPTEPEKKMRTAIALDPKDPMTRFYFAHRVERQNPSLAREQLEAALVSDPGHVLARTRLSQLAQSAGRTIESRHHLERALAVDPDFVPAVMQKGRLDFNQGEAGAWATLELQKKESLGSAALHSELAHMYRSLENRQAAINHAKKALALDFENAPARRLLINLLLETGHAEKALNHLENDLLLRPWSLGTRLRKARILSGSASQREQALHTLDEAAKQFPDAPQVAILKADLLLWGAQNEAAVAALDRALELDPHQPSIRRRRGTLSGDQQELEDNYTTQLSALENLPVQADERTWGAIFLADRTAIRLYENGKSTRFHQKVIRIHNKGMKDRLRVQQVAYSPSREVVEILSADRVRPNGEILKANHINDQAPRGKIGGMYLDRRTTTIVFDDLDSGDLIHIRYRVDSIGQNIFGGFFGDVSTLRGLLPKKNVLYTVTSPANRPIYARGIRATEPKRQQDQDTVTLSWKYEHLDALELEPFSPPYAELGTLVSVSTYRDWSDLGKWYARLFSEQLTIDEDARRAGKRAVRGARTEREKMERLYEYVVKNTRYVGIELGIHGWKPFKASEVHRRRYGDCKDKATLLIALLEDNGIDATMALVRTSDRGHLPHDHATMWAFNHAIAYVPSQNRFLDATAEFSGSTELPRLDQGAMALIVHPDGETRLTQLPESEPKDNLNSSEYQAVLTKNGGLRLNGTENFLGVRASALRKELEVPELRKKHIQEQLSQIFSGVKVLDLKLSDITNLEAPVQYRYEATVDQYAAVKQDHAFIPVALFRHGIAKVYARLAKRKHDLFAENRWSTRNVVDYRLPPGSKIKVLPKGLHIDTRHIALEQTVTPTKHGFRTDDTVTLKSRRIPASDYPEFRQACLAVDRALSRRVVIQW